MHSRRAAREWVFGGQALIAPPRLSRPDRLVIALARCWSSGRGRGGNPLPAMLGVAQDIPDCTLVPACDSYFALTEVCLARPLRVATAPHGDDRFRHRLTTDELALLTALRHCPLSTEAVRMPPGIPHGLPHALCWAAYAVRRALGISHLPCTEMSHCPFSAQAGFRPALLFGT